MGRARTLYGRPKLVAKLYPYNCGRSGDCVKWVRVNLTKNPYTMLMHTSREEMKALEMEMEMKLIAIKNKRDYQKAK